MKNIAIFYGGKSCEHDVSIITALSAFRTLKTKCPDFDVTLVYMRDGRFYIGDKLEKIETYKSFSAKKLRETYFIDGSMYESHKMRKNGKKIYCALVCNHGGTGENGALSGFLNIAEIPHTASPVLGSAICMDKVFSKQFLEKNKFPVVQGCTFYQDTPLETAEKLGYPLIIKPANLGSSVGITYAKTREELVSGLELSLQFDSKCLVEKALQNFNEYNCGAYRFEDKVITSEIEQAISQAHFLNFEDKYTAKSTATREVPAKIDEKLAERIKHMTSEIYSSLELSGVVRIDYLFADGKLYVNEINTIPGSLCSYLFGKLPSRELYTKLIENAVSEYKNKAKLLNNFASDILKDFSANAVKGAKSGVKN